MQYRDVVHHCLDFTMAELSAFIWYGGGIAELGPPGFKKLWANLQPALWHYMYNRSASAEDMREAARHLRSYAEDLERYVIRGWVCNFKFSSLHRRQEQIVSSLMVPSALRLRDAANVAWNNVCTTVHVVHVQGPASEISFGLPLGAQRSY
jgi:hypothetical protein